jgi:hypothetical protein
MAVLENADLTRVLEKHQKWLNGEEGGERADLRNVDLQGVMLRDADLRRADFQGADLRDADLQSADLKDADLQGANFRWADLQDADLAGADLRGANIDFSAWPLWCGSFDVRVDRRIATQIAYHFCRLNCDDPEYLAAREALARFANTFHRVEECGRIAHESHKD